MKQQSAGMNNTNTATHQIGSDLWVGLPLNSLGRWEEGLHVSGALLRVSVLSCLSYYFPSLVFIVHAQ